MNERRWLSIMIGVFGCLCFIYAALCAYSLKSLAASETTQFLTYDIIAKAINMREAILVSTLFFALAALISLVSAIGIFLEIVWASKVWLCSTVLIFAYNLFAFYNNPSGWMKYLAIIVLCLYSWFILWYQPRKILHKENNQ